MDSQDAVRLERVARGLGLVFAGLALLVLVGNATVLLLLFLPELPLLSAGLFLGVVVLAIGLHLVGQVFCLWVPSDSTGRAIVLAAVGLNVLGKLVAGLEAVAEGWHWWDTPAAPMLLATLAELFSVVSALTFLVFLKRLASSLGSNRGEIMAENVLLLWLLCLGLYVICFGLMEVMLRTQSVSTLWMLLYSPGTVGVVLLPVVFVLGVLMMGLGVLAFIRYCNLLTFLRETILKSVERASANTRKSGLAPVDQAIRV
jgi:hypothetical protein